MTTEGTLGQLRTAFDDLRQAAEALTEEQFFRKTAPEKWSAAEEVVHLTLTYVPFVRLLPHPEVLLQRWGDSGRPSRDPATFQADYKAATGTQPWMTFPPFVPMLEDEPDDYISLHASQSHDKVKQFYDQSGSDMSQLRQSVPIRRVATRDGLLDEFTKQSQRLADAAQQMNESHLDSCQLPLPYLGFITVREGLYFTVTHTQHHCRSITGP